MNPFIDECCDHYVKREVYTTPKAIVEYAVMRCCNCKNEVTRKYIMPISTEACHGKFAAKTYDMFDTVTNIIGKTLNHCPMLAEKPITLPVVS